MNRNQLGVLKRTGKRSQAEHLRFLRGLRVYGRDWKQISRVVRTRDSRQVKSHAQKFFIKLMKAGNPAYTAEMFELDQDDLYCETETSDEVSAFTQPLESVLSATAGSPPSGCTDVHQAIVYHLSEAARLFSSSISQLMFRNLDN